MTSPSAYEGDYAIDTRTVLQVETDGQPLSGCPFALNDVAILKRDVAAKHQRTHIERMGSYRRDGKHMGAGHDDRTAY